MSTEDSPPYTFSGPAPSYSREPGTDEERLAYTLSIPQHYIRHTGHFTKTTQDVTLTLHQQDDKTAVPTYERNSIITGTIAIGDCTRVRSVAVKLQCRIELNIDGRSESIKILSNTYTLWTQINGQPCPDIHDFAILFKPVYNAGGKTLQLPPSYDINIRGSCSAKCIYNLKVQVTKGRSSLAFLTEIQWLNVFLNYRPRSFPPRPISSTPFLSGMKNCPEEWHQIVSNITPRPDSQIPAITCNMFIPSVQIFSFSGAIHFHIQLSGPLAALRALLAIRSSNHPPPPPKPTQSIGLHVFLSREIKIDMYRRRAIRTCDYSDTPLQALPPQTLNFGRENQDEIILDFEGQVRCSEAIHSTGFVTDNLTVQDFIVVSWTPIHPRSPFLPFRHAHPIKLVTDPWIEGL